jgi:pimeloyl-ACP methyl ester carboxylesterase
MSDPATEPVLRHVTCAHPGGLHRLAYWQWGDPANPDVVLCVHGLTRNGRDFDALAQRLAARRRVVCPDIVGRGRSDRLRDPNLYGVPQYVADCVTLIARLDVERLSWIGTSMGGLIGMSYAALPGNAVGRLVLNDVGPEIDPVGLQRIAAYVGADPRFPSFEVAEQALRLLMVNFGPHTDEQFRLLSRHALVRIGDTWGMSYDPAIAVPVRATVAALAASGAQPPSLWPLYDQITCPTLVLRGAQSDVLSPEAAVQMSERGPRAQVVQFDGVGHAPTLIADDQIAAVAGFLG